MWLQFRGQGGALGGCQRPEDVDKREHPISPGSDRRRRRSVRWRCEVDPSGGEMAMDEIRAVRFSGMHRGGKSSETKKVISYSVAARLIAFTATAGAGAATIVRQLSCRAFENLGTGRRRRATVDLDRYGKPVHAGRRADIDDFRFGDAAVGKNCQVAAAGQDVRCPPVRFDDAALRPTIYIDPVAWPIRPA